MYTFVNDIHVRIIAIGGPVAILPSPGGDVKKRGADERNDYGTATDRRVGVGGEILYGVWIEGKGVKG